MIYDITNVQLVSFGTRDGIACTTVLRDASLEEVGASVHGDVTNKWELRQPNECIYLWRMQRKRTGFFLLNNAGKPRVISSRSAMNSIYACMRLAFMPGRPWGSAANMRVIQVRREC